MHFTTLLSAIALASTATSQPTARQAPTANAVIMIVNSADNSRQPVRIPLAQLTTLDYQVTELRLESLNVNIPDIESPELGDVVCQRYKDRYGVQLGSVEFSHEQPALISTNPVEFGWVLCYHKNRA
ncbi:hypothetical protein FPANT_5729 [Fusarium pseudoanthophilum]|uniref:Uncharacterized protein n=1 Tax=Fusarium pseudoanthophilum TaxID=48495 RepID=A0A8H5P725_9HYPO|nr:hypothetical protein FPANT_5729 [Fusarium pseudoanthophilum]